MNGEAVEDGKQIAVPPMQPGPGTKRVYDAVRELVSRWTDDRVLHGDLVVLGDAVRSGRFA